MLKKKGDDEERCPDCTVSASGHCGEIDLKPGSCQVLYLQAPAATLPTISWCCPSGLSLSIPVNEPPRLLEGIVVAAGGQREAQTA